MKEYSVTITIKKSYGSCVDADSKPEAIQKALKEWDDDLYGIDVEDLDIEVEELYDESIGF